MKFLHALALVGFTFAAAASTASADVRLSIDNGRVSLVATNATLRQILAEWEKVGQTKIVNLERVPGGPQTLELQNMPEDQALDLLLRPVTGYLAAPRALAIANTSRFDRIVVMPTIAAPPRAVAAAPSPTFNAPPPTSNDDDRDDEGPAPNVVPTPNPRGPVFNSFPQPRVVNPQSEPTSVPGAYPPQQADPDGSDPGVNPGVPSMPPGAVSTPGMIAPSPAPGQPGAPVRRPGGGRGGR